MRIHDEHSRFVLVPDLSAGDVVEPGFLHREQVTIHRTPQKVKDSDTLYGVIGKLDSGEVVLEFLVAGDGVWVFPPET